MATLEQDTFIRTAVGAGSWGTATNGDPWTITSGTAADFSTNGTQGVMANTGGRSHTRIGSTSDTNQIVTCDVTPSNVSNDEFGINARQSGTVGTGISFYRLTYNPSIGGLVLFKAVTGTATQLGSTITKSVSNLTKYTFKLSCIGTTIQGKMWLSSGSEPGSWDITVTDSAVTSGAPGCTGNSFDATGIRYENFLATDGSTAVDKAIATRFNQFAIADKTIATRFFQYDVADKKIATRFNQFAVADKAISTRFNQYDIAHKAISTRFNFILVGLKAIATRFNQYDTADKAIATRFNQYDTTDKKIATRFNQYAVAPKAIATRFNQYDPNSTSQMLYDDLQTQYTRLRASTTNSHIIRLALVYYSPAQILNEHVIPGELDVLLSGETTFHILKSIKDVSDFITAHP